jgi:alpha-L-fucosidase
MENNEGMKTLIHFVAILGFCGAVMAQHDPEVREKLEAWQDLKFGLLMHWGPYSQWGVVESWSICSEDWITRRDDDYEEYKRNYRALKKTFNPVKFDPLHWAEAAKTAGMKYVVFTTKHHDGFCMFDSKLTDYKITSPECPFDRDVTKEIFDAFRAKGFWTGIYFSKPDWSCEYYWWPYYATPDRHVNYDPAKHPERWNKFRDFTYGQIEELMTGYGPVDILWLDGAWVRPIDNMPEEFESWAKKNDWNQDIDMARIAKMARRHQPGLIVVDRWVSGPYEDYDTPEQRVPEKPIDHPWESCITMADGWSYNAGHKYKPVRRLIHMLVEIVAKGGNFLLNIGPSPEGQWAPEAYDRLEGIGKWMAVNGEAIYGTRAMKPCREGRCFFTRREDGTWFAVYLAGEDEGEPPAHIRLQHGEPPAEVTLLGFEGTLSWRTRDEYLEIEIPRGAIEHPPCRHAWAFRISP